MSLEFLKCKKRFNPWEPLEKEYRNLFLHFDVFLDTLSRKPSNFPRKHCCAGRLVHIVVETVHARAPNTVKAHQHLHIKGDTFPFSTNKNRMPHRFSGSYLRIVLWKRSMVKENCRPAVMKYVLDCLWMFKIAHSTLHGTSSPSPNFNPDGTSKKATAWHRGSALASIPRRL